MELTGNNYTRNDWRKALSTRRGTILVAIACAIVAAGILALAMSRYRNHVDAGVNQQTVLVASGLIQKGTAGDAIASGQLFKPTSIAAKQASAGAILDTAQLHGQVAKADIEPGQQLTAADFTNNGGLPAKLAPTQRAMTITFDSAHGMVGQLHDGDHVDVYADVQLGGSGESVLRRLLANVPVLVPGTGASAGLGANSPQSQQSNVTLNVENSKAGELAYAADNGKVWLVLRPANASEASSQGAAVTAQSLLLGSGQNGGGSK